MAWMGRAFVQLAIWSLKAAGCFVGANDRAALHGTVHLVSLLTLSPTERAREMSKS